MEEPMNQAIIIAVFLLFVVLAAYKISRRMRRYHPPQLSDVLRSGCIKVKIASPR